MAITAVLDVNIRNMQEVFRENARGIRALVGRSLFARAQFIGRLAASLAPIDTGQLRRSLKVAETRRGNFRITFRRAVRRAVHGRGFDIAFWLHEARNPNDMGSDRFSYTPSVSVSAAAGDIGAGAIPSAGGVNLQAVGRKYLERASRASVEFVRFGVARDLQEFFDQNELGVTGDPNIAVRRRLFRRGGRAPLGRGQTDFALRQARSARGQALVARIHADLDLETSRLVRFREAVATGDIGAMRALVAERRGF